MEKPQSYYTVHPSHRAAKDRNGRRVYKAVILTRHFRLERWGGYSEHKETKVLGRKDLNWSRTQGDVFATKEEARAYANHVMKDMLTHAKERWDKAEKELARVKEVFGADSPRLKSALGNLETWNNQIEALKIEDLEYDETSKITDGRDWEEKRSEEIDDVTADETYFMNKSDWSK